MKRSFNILSALAFVGLFLSACYTEIDLDKYRPDPKVVLNSAIKPDSLISASVSRTWFYAEQDPDIIISDASVELFINGHFMEQMSWQPGAEEERGMYRSSYAAKEGDTIKIMATTSYGKVWAEDRVPVKVPIEKVAISQQKSDWTSTVLGYEESDGSIVAIERLCIDINYEITFTDDPAVENYYLIRVEDYSSQPWELGMGSLEYSSDPVFIGEKTVLEGLSTEEGLWGQGGRTFSDASINGRRYTLRIKEKGLIPSYMLHPDVDTRRHIVLYSLSKPYFQYLSDLQNSEDENVINVIEGMGLAEPLRTYSNINGGTGILGSCQTADYTVDLLPILPEED